MNLNPLVPPMSHVPTDNTQTVSHLLTGSPEAELDFTTIDFSYLHARLRELQSMGADGLPLLEHLASELSMVFGTEVKALINSDNRLCLVWTVAK